MSEEPQPDDRIRISDAERHAVAERLREAAGEGRLELEELDERLEATYAARTRADLVPLTDDLPSAGPSLAKRPQSEPVTAAGSPTSGTAGSPQRFVAVMSGVERRGVWTVPAQATIVAVMGGADLDMREARFESREVVLTANAVMGGVHVVVPPDVEVVMEGIGVMGGFSGPSGSHALPEQHRVLRVKGVAIWGGVQVERKAIDEGRGRSRHWGT